ncbi:hypothetical protein [Naasia aerilata]|uniref:Cation-transporting P-type ATPase C-terminal domain-containing protein n=1 Tax=Naasia aerilata TaxID=1162966 RepID=A0ABN6XPH0_9MICO|nr:hypothetical protein GCM10025866_28280 [Naasia aerilata]
MCAGLALVLAVPLATDFLALELPPAPLLVAVGLATVGVGGAVELLARLHGRRFGSRSPAVTRVPAPATASAVPRGEAVRDLRP